MPRPELIDISEILAVGASSTTTTGDDGYGVTSGGFVPKPFARLLAERIDTARKLFGDDIDLGASSVIRKTLELSALEDARLWGALANTYDASFIATARGGSLSMLGDELGVPRPFEFARGRVTLTLGGDGAATFASGTRLLTPGGHHAATLATVELSPTNPSQEVDVEAFYPGPSHNLDPSEADPAGVFTQRLDAFHPADTKLPSGFEDVTIDHREPLTGGDRTWDDTRYRQMLLHAPRSVWTQRALQQAVELVPGVRAVRASDPFGGLDVQQPIFGQFNFLERLFGQQRNPFGVYQARIVVAPTAAAIWEGPDGLEAAVRQTIDAIRPIGIHPEIVPAVTVGIRVTARIIVHQTPMPIGSAATINTSAAADAIRRRLSSSMREQIARLGFGEPVRGAQLSWALMNDPAVADVAELRVERFRRFEGFTGPADPDHQTVSVAADEVATLMEQLGELTIEVSP